MPEGDELRVRGKRIPSRKRELARRLRRNMTPAESLLWDQLHAGRLCHAWFRRQHVIAGFIVDFYCHAALLAVEVDGPIHARQAVEDARREEALATFGVRVIRFSNDAVMNDMPGVLRAIAAALASQKANLETLPQGANSSIQKNSPLPRGEG